MIRKDYRSYVIAKLREDASDPDVVSQVNDFIDQRNRMIWEVADWQDAWILYPATLAAGVSDLILPDSIERVAMVRAGNIRMPNVSPHTQMEFDPTYFDAANGTPTQYRNATRLATDALPDGGKVKLNSASVVDNTVGTSIVYLTGIKSYQRVEEAIQLNGSYQVESVNSYDFIFTQGKPVTTGEIYIRLSSTNALISTMSPVSKDKFNPRIVLTQTPSASTSCLILARLGCPILQNDYSVPVLTGVEHCLKEFALYDMLWTQRQVGKAQVAMQTANALLQALSNSEQNIGGLIKRMIPWADAQNRTAGSAAMAGGWNAVQKF